MPTIKIDTTLQPVQEELPQFLQTSHGLALIEIQGTINKPDAVVEGANEMFQKTKIGNHSVKIGQLKLNGDKAELSVGKNQKLLGSLKKLDKPIGILKFPERKDAGDAYDEKFLETEKVRLIDIVKYKILFSNRPVPQQSS